MSDVNFSKLDKKQGAGGSFCPSMLLIPNVLLVAVNVQIQIEPQDTISTWHIIPAVMLGTSTSTIAILFLLADHALPLDYSAS